MYSDISITVTVFMQAFLNINILKSVFNASAYHRDPFTGSNAQKESSTNFAVWRFNPSMKWPHRVSPNSAFQTILSKGSQLPLYKHLYGLSDG